MLNIIVPIKEVTRRKIYIGDSVNFAEAKATKPKEAIANPKRLNVSLLKSSSIVNSSQNYQDGQIFISAHSSKNYIPFRLKMIFHSRGDFVSHSCLAIARSLNIGLTENSSRYRSCFFEAPEFSQIAFGDFVKPCVNRNMGSRLQEDLN